MHHKRNVLSVNVNLLKENILQSLKTMTKSIWPLDDNNNLSSGGKSHTDAVNLHSWQQKTHTSVV